eukprot:5819716-Pyramimonas_sp.AAC.2
MSTRTSVLSYGRVCTGAGLRSRDCVGSPAIARAVQTKRPRGSASRSACGARADLYYFAYGSNVNTTVLVQRRGVKPKKAVPCVLHGYSLEFSVPGSYEH